MSYLTRNPHLDILRGVSILLVFLGHSIPPAFPHHPLFAPFFDAAFGVRIFFVLSGFIITSLLLSEKKRFGKIQWRDFLIKRFSKLLPSLILLVLVIQAFQWSWLGACSTRDSVVSLFFLSEILGISCWELAHTWSLSVEELFYISWIPCFILFSERQLIKILLVVCCVAPFFRAYTHLTHSHPEWFASELIFSLPLFSHLDLIAWGCLGAFSWNYFPVLLKDRLGRRTLKLRIGYTFFVLLLFFSALPFGKFPYLKLLDYLAIPFRSTFQGVFLLGLIFTSILMTPHRPNIFKRFLAYLGSISYSLYVIQQIIIPSPYIESTQKNWSIQSAASYFLLALAIGALNYHFVEIPCLKYLRKKCNVVASELVLP